jgi:hypothetical protein
MAPKTSGGHCDWLHFASADWAMLSAAHSLYPTPPVPVPDLPPVIPPSLAEQDACGRSCLPVCEWAFQRVMVLPRIPGGTRVEWFLHPEFRDPLPHTYRLLVGTTGHSQAEDWAYVGLPAINTYYLVDDEQRIYGKTQWTHYVIELTTPLGTYYSKPQSCFGAWTFTDWRRAESILRLERLALQQNPGNEGYLLKVKVAGTPCECIDTMTMEVRNPQCTICLGSGIVGGYHPAMECCWAALYSETSHDRVSGDAGKPGTVNDLVIRARMLAVPPLFERDVWVQKDSDQRYYVHSVKSKTEIRSVPLIYDPVELRMAPFTDPIYSVEIPDQVPS